MKPKSFLYHLLPTLLLSFLGILCQSSYQAACTISGCDICVTRVCRSCNSTDSYYPQLNSGGTCEKCPTGCTKCIRSGSTNICSECSDSSKYPKTNSTECVNCPTGCKGCQLVNGSISCVACQDGYSKDIEGLIMKCNKDLEWWGWALIILGILVVIGILIAILNSMRKKKPKNSGPYNEYEMN